MQLTLNGMLVALTLFTMTALATDKQNYIMENAYRIAKTDGGYDPSILQGIVMTESTAGEGKTKRNMVYGSVGVSQIVIGTAKQVLEVFPDLAAEYFPKGFTNRQLAKKLNDDDIFNLRIASKYIIMLTSQFGLTGDKLIAAYNRGPAGNLKNAGNIKYVKRVKKFAQTELALDNQKADVVQPEVIDIEKEFTSEPKYDIMTFNDKEIVLSDKGE
jgi:hypothetical protein